MNLTRNRLLLAAVLLAVILAGCGKKTRPVPPDTVLPAPIADLTYQLDEKGVELRWSFPRTTVQGERLPYRIEKFELLRAVIPAKDYCEGCPVPFGPPIEIVAEMAGKGQVLYQETLLRPGHRYIYRVRSIAGWFVRSDDSNAVSFLWDTPLQAPSGLKIEAGDQSLNLSWQAVAGLLDGKPVDDPIRYQILRSSDGGETFAGLPGEPLTSLTYTDKGLRNGKIYLYKVRALRLHDGTTAAGLTSPAVAGTPRDLMPPAPPRQLKLVATPKEVKLIWEAGLEPDLAGFSIYRRTAKSKTPEKIGEVRGAGLSFVDRKPPKKKGLYYYSVTAFDRAEPANESAPSLEAVYQVGD